MKELLDENGGRGLTNTLLKSLLLVHLQKDSEEKTRILYRDSERREFEKVLLWQCQPLYFKNGFTSYYRPSEYFEFAYEVI
jgi:hypothetical protein